MTTDEIIKMAFELGSAVAESDEIVNMKAAQQQVSADQKAYELIMQYQDAKTKAENKLQDGLALSKIEEDHLDILEQQLNSNAIIGEMMSAQEKFDNLMQAIYFAMNQALGGGGCSSGCDSCGGGCDC
ncbi:MAG: YlbF family regulator [Syntrophomonadaceae bacterium]|nr:YlbF family regulator [Syntrophomonadaceae bacterium]MDD3023017.1 YlbF family regulator [Syntrophomonadaceae bacterium]